MNVHARTKYGTLTIHGNATVRIETRRWSGAPVLFVGDASRAHVRDRIAMPDWPVWMWGVVVKSVRSR